MKRQKVLDYLNGSIVLLAKASGNVEDGMHYNKDALTKLGLAQDYIAKARTMLRAQKVNSKAPGRTGGTTFRYDGKGNVVR